MMPKLLSYVYVELDVTPRRYKAGAEGRGIDLIVEAARKSNLPIEELRVTRSKLFARVHVPLEDVTIAQLFERAAALRESVSVPEADQLMVGVDLGNGDGDKSAAALVKVARDGTRTIEDLVISGKGQHAGAEELRTAIHRRSETDELVELFDQIRAAQEAYVHEIGVPPTHVLMTAAMRYEVMRRIGVPRTLGVFDPHIGLCGSILGMRIMLSATTDPHLRLPLVMMLP